MCKVLSSVWDIVFIVNILVNSQSNARKVGEYYDCGPNVLGPWPR